MLCYDRFIGRMVATAAEVGTRIQRSAAFPTDSCRKVRRQGLQARQRPVGRGAYRRRDGEDGAAAGAARDEAGRSSPYPGAAEERTQRSAGEACQGRARDARVAEETALRNPSSRVGDQEAESNPIGNGHKRFDDFIDINKDIAKNNKKVEFILK
jgi:hypothetical protein